MKKFEPAVFIPAAILIFAGVGYAVLAGIRLKPCSCIFA